MRISRLLGADGRAQAGRAVEARVLPREVARFYRRALAAAVDARDTSTLAAIPAPRDLLALLEVARGCEEVVELGRDDPVSPVALAIDDPRRKVTAFRAANAAAATRYMELADPSVRARIAFHTRALESAPLATDRRASLAVIEGSSDHRSVEAALETARGAVRPGALVVLRRHGDPSYRGVGEAVAELALDGYSLPQQLYLWRTPLEEPPPVAEPAKAKRARRLPRVRPAVIAVALAVIAIGAGVAVLVTQGGGDDEQTASTAAPAPAAQVPPPPPPQQSAPATGATGTTGTTTTPGSRQGGTGSQSRGGGSRNQTRFSGTGTQTLDPVKVRRNSTLEWTIAGGEIEIKSKKFELNSNAHRGQTAIPRGTYRGLRVKASTPWTLQILPR